MQFSVTFADKIFSLFLIFIPLLAGLLHAFLKKGKKLDYILLYYIVIGIGIQALASGIMQIFFSSSVSQYVDWPFSPFMIELGLANISYGILGLLSPWMKRDWQMATTCGYALFLLFTGMRHVIEILEKGVNVGNSGSFMFVDILLSFILFVLLFYKSKENLYKSLPHAQSHRKFIQ